MAKYHVFGQTRIGVKFTVEAASREDAMDKAYDQWPGLTNFVGNGGYDKLIGVYGNEISLDADPGYDVEFTDVDED